MSAILSADDLNDFISPGVACIKPIETLPVKSDSNSNPYEVTTEENVTNSDPPPPAQLSLTDCLACSGCVTSAEAMLVSLQSHTEVLKALDADESVNLPRNILSPVQQSGKVLSDGTIDGITRYTSGKCFVASVSPQVRASLAATFRMSERRAGYLIEQLLQGPYGLKAGGAHGSHFNWVIDTNTVRDAVLVLAAEEAIPAVSPECVFKEGSETVKKPVLTSACPGWICYAEKQHPYILPYLSTLKSPQALSGTLVKSVLFSRFGIPPERVWHLAVMPCFDKKLEASRSELTSGSWLSESSGASSENVRDVDCVITAQELVHLAAARGIDLFALPPDHISQPQFPDPFIHEFLFRPKFNGNQPSIAGPSGGYLYHILSTITVNNPGSTIKVEKGRNFDVSEYKIIENGQEIFKAARFYGFRNIQNLVRRLRPAKASRMPGAAVDRRLPSRRTIGNGSSSLEYAYVEVMACPGGCTNGGGQIKVDEVANIRNKDSRSSTQSANGSTGTFSTKAGPKEQREWLSHVDEAYFSAESSESDGSDNEKDMMDIDSSASSSSSYDEIFANTQKRREEKPYFVNGVDVIAVRSMLQHWSQLTGIELSKLVTTTYRVVEDDTGKSKSNKKNRQSDVERVAGLASSLGGGW